VEAYAQPQQVMVGESGRYTLRISDASGVPNLIAPRVDGLEFSSNPSTSSRTEMINGNVSRYIEVSWVFRPLREGSFTIPGRPLRIAGTDLQANPVTIRVVPQSEEARSRAMLLLTVPEGPFYVGEVVPASLRLLIRRDISLSGAEFTEVTEAVIQTFGLDEQPVRTNVRIDGLVYTALIWEFHLSPVRSGEMQLSFRQRASLQLNDNNDRMGGFFGFSRGRVENVALQSDPVAITVLPVPRTNRPDSFRDAVGQLTVTSSWSSRKLTVGEPVTFTLQVSGTANFDRISAPELPEWEGWRVYPPRSDFVAHENPLNGTKSFEYILMPQTTDIDALPAFDYSHFDPSNGEFITTRFAAEPVTVAPGSGPSGGPVVFGQRRAADDTRSLIAPLRSDPGHLPRLPLTVLGSTGFWTGNAAGLLALSGALWMLRRRELRGRDVLANLHDVGNRKVRAHLRSAAEAAASGSADAFFGAARAALQERIRLLSSNKVEASSLVTSDCIDLLTTADADSDTIAGVQQLLDLADARSFAGTAAGGEDLKGLLEQLTRCLQSIPAKR
jgi:hypothetical protein